MWPLLAQQNLPILTASSHQWTKWHEQSPAVGSGQQKFEEKPHVHCALCTMCTGHWAGYRVQCACRGVIGQIKGRLFQLIHQTIWLKLARQDIFFLLHLIVNSQFSFLRVQLFSQWMWQLQREERLDKPAGINVVIKTKITTNTETAMLSGKGRQTA